MNRMIASRRKAYERLQELLFEAQSASYGWSGTQVFSEWDHAVSAALRRMFGNSTEHADRFDRINYTLNVLHSGTTSQDHADAFDRGMTKARALIKSAIREFEDYELESSSEPSEAIPSKDVASGEASRNVFVVHGHDEEMKQTVARFLEQLDLNAIILHEKANQGQTLIEKFEHNSDVSFAVVLLSPDDLGEVRGKAEDGELRPRARQNVVLELGFFMGRLRRSRVCPLVRGDVELPSDSDGIVYISYDSANWRLDLVREIKAAGLDIDANKAL